MQIVIDIDEDTYRYMQSRFKYQNKDDKVLSTFEIAGVAIKNGIVLPKGHGRLIDADKAIEVLSGIGNRDYRREKGTISDAMKMLNYDEYIPTIIEAEKEDAE